MAERGKRIIFFIESAQGACTRYRAHIPAHGLTRDGWYCRVSTEWHPKMLDEFDYYVFQRVNAKEGLEVIDALNGVGKITIYDVDDDILHVPNTSPVRALLRSNPEIVGAQLLGISSCGHLTVTTEALKRVYDSFNPDICVLPNMVRFESWRDVKPFRFGEPNDIVLGWAGSNTHKDALLKLEKPINTIIDRFPNVKFLVMGDEIPFELPASRHIVVPWGLYTFFQSVLAGLDIVLAPLGETVFNLSKSNLRILEAASASKPVIASSWGEYETTITHGVDGFLCKTDEDWIEAMTFYIHDKALRENHAMRLRQTVLERGWEINTGTKIWVDFYQSLRNKLGA